MCLQKEARKRPTVHTLLNCKFFKIKRSVTPFVNELLCHISDVSVTISAQFKTLRIIHYSCRCQTNQILAVMAIREHALPAQY